MPLLAPLAALLGIEVSAITARVRSMVIAYAVVAILGLVGAIFLLVAGYLALAREIGGIYAALSIAGVFLVVALAVLFSMRISEARRRRELAQRRSSEAGAFATTAALTAFPTIVRSPALRLLAIPAVAVAAFFLVRNGTRGDKDE